MLKLIVFQYHRKVENVIETMLRNTELLFIALLESVSRSTSQ